MNINYRQANLSTMSDILENNPEMTFGELLHHIKRNKFTAGVHPMDLSDEQWYNILETAKKDESLEKDE